MKIRNSLLGRGKKAISLAAAGFLAAGVLGAAPSAFADSHPQASGDRQGVFGSVTAKAASSFTVQTRDGQTVELVVNDQTKFRVPNDDTPSFEDVTTGSRVAVLALRTDAGLVALQVMPVPGVPQREHRVLTVVSIEGKTLTAQDAQGNQIIVELNQEVSPELEGQLAIFIGERSQQSNRFKANAEVKIQQIVDRLEKLAAQLEDENPADTQTQERRQQALDQVHERLEANKQRHLDRLAKVIEKAPAQARPALERARDRFQEKYQTDKPGDNRGRGHDGDGAKPATGSDVRDGVPSGDRGRGRGHDDDGAKPVTGAGVRGGPSIGENRGENRGRGGDEHSRGSNREWAVVEGQITAVNNGGKSLDIRTGRGETLSLKVGNTVTVKADNRNLSLAQLAVGQKVVGKYNLAAGEIIELMVVKERAAA
ncbi:MAG: hypothetical protein FJ316_05200 [SAR202 cluster bacterium]|nr:hypothetical protein [SAR202 cluster bacterium]